MNATPPKPEGSKKHPAPPPPVVLADVKLTVRSPLPLVFEALVNADRVSQWWGSDVRIEAELGGRYEGTLVGGRVEGTITGIDGPNHLSFMWPIERDEGGPIETSVVYELAPKGPQTFIHLLHRSPLPVPGDWGAVWSETLESLRAYLEGGSATSG